MAQILLDRGADVGAKSDVSSGTSCLGLDCVGLDTQLKVRDASNGGFSLRARDVTQPSQSSYQCPCPTIHAPIYLDRSMETCPCTTQLLKATQLWPSFCWTGVRTWTPRTM